MMRTLLPLAAAFLAAALPAAAQSTKGPTPNEQVGMHIGDTNTNGSAVIVTDRNGTHPEGYPGMAVRNRVAGDRGPSTPHHGRHHRHRVSDQPAG